MLRRVGARPILICVATIAEPGLRRLHHALNIALTR
jgi:hypothetical protein